jgi:hypothetical protein
VQYIEQKSARPSGAALFFKSITNQLKINIMAVFQLGAAITGIVGSSGGTTFKRNKGLNVWMNKSRGATRSRNLQNIRLANNSVIFKSWNALPDEDKAGWNANAAATKVKDKFGKDFYLSGVALQRKCNLTAQLLGFSDVPYYNFNTTLYGLQFNASVISWTGGAFTANITQLNPGYGESYICFMLEFTLNNLNAPQFTRRGVFSVQTTAVGTSFDLWNDMMAKYPFLNSGYNLRLYAFEANEVGWQGVQIFINPTVS